MPIMDPQWPAVASVRELGAEAMPPLWQYLCLRQTKPLELICAPKRVGPRRSSRFPCKSATSEGAEKGAKGVDHGPPQLPAPLTR